MRFPAKHLWRQTFEDLTAQGQLAFDFVCKAISIRVVHVFLKGKASLCRWKDMICQTIKSLVKAKLVMNSFSEGCVNLLYDTC